MQQIQDILTKIVLILMVTNQIYQKSKSLKILDQDRNRSNAISAKLFDEVHKKYNIKSQSHVKLQKKLLYF